MTSKLADPFKFQGAGVNFKGKLIGVDDVSNARGDLMCQDSMAKLKQSVKIRGEHKQKLTINVSLEGIKIADEATGSMLHTHEVSKISFISRDMTDARAFGYVYEKGPDKKYQFIAIKTQQAAENLVLTLQELFQTIFELKKKKAEEEGGESKEDESHYQDQNDDGGLTIVSGTTTAVDTTEAPEKPVRVEEPATGGLIGVDDITQGVQKTSFAETFDAFSPSAAAPAAAAADPWGGSATQQQPAQNDPFTTALAPPPAANKPAATAQNDPFTVNVAAPAAAASDPFNTQPAATNIASALGGDPFAINNAPQPAATNGFGASFDSAFGAPAPVTAAQQSGAPPGLFDSNPLLPVGGEKAPAEPKKEDGFGGLVSLDLSNPGVKNDPFAAKAPPKRSMNEMKSETAPPLDLGATDPFGLGSLGGQSMAPPAAPQVNPAAPFAGAFDAPAPAPMGGMGGGFGQPMQQRQPQMFGNNVSGEDSFTELSLRESLPESSNESTTEQSKSDQHLHSDLANDSMISSKSDAPSSIWSDTSVPCGSQSNVSDSDFASFASFDSPSHSSDNSNTATPKLKSILRKSEERSVHSSLGDIVEDDFIAPPSAPPPPLPPDITDKPPVPPPRPPSRGTVPRPGSALSWASIDISLDNPPPPPPPRPRAHSSMSQPGKLEFPSGAPPALPPRPPSAAANPNASSQTLKLPARTALTDTKQDPFNKNKQKPVYNRSKTIEDPFSDPFFTAPKPKAVSLKRESSRKEKKHKRSGSKDNYSSWDPFPEVKLKSGKDPFATNRGCRTPDPFLPLTIASDPFAVNEPQSPEPVEHAPTAKPEESQPFEAFASFPEDTTKPVITDQIKSESQKGEISDPFKTNWAEFPSSNLKESQSIKAFATFSADIKKPDQIDNASPKDVTNVPRVPKDLNKKNVITGISVPRPRSKTPDPFNDSFSKLSKESTPMEKAPGVDVNNVVQSDKTADPFATTSPEKGVSSFSTDFDPFGLMTKTKSTVINDPFGSNLNPPSSDKFDAFGVNTSRSDLDPFQVPQQADSFTTVLKSQSPIQCVQLAEASLGESDNDSMEKVDPFKSTQTQSGSASSLNNLAVFPDNPDISDPVQMEFEADTSQPFVELPTQSSEKSIEDWQGSSQTDTVDPFHISKDISSIYSVDSDSTSPRLERLRKESTRSHTPEIIDILKSESRNLNNLNRTTDSVGSVDRKSDISVGSGNIQTDIGQTPKNPGNEDLFSSSNDLVEVSRDNYSSKKMAAIHRHTPIGILEDVADPFDTSHVVNDPFIKVQSSEINSSKPPISGTQDIKLSSEGGLNSEDISNPDSDQKHLGNTQSESPHSTVAKPTEMDNFANFSFDSTSKSGVIDDPFVVSRDIDIQLRTAPDGQDRLSDTGYDLHQNLATIPATVTAPTNAIKDNSDTMQDDPFVVKHSIETSTLSNTMPQTDLFSTTQSQPDSFNTAANQNAPFSMSANEKASLTTPTNQNVLQDSGRHSADPFTTGGIDGSMHQQQQSLGNPF
ncbi:unnamed protein product [Owenia fusiformis]|uniref:PID domain-containing protein n=1 Tax=Owenia fusiformis TaxID=6347 RepID=A0A8S4N1E4_OWEFU|nr:unnamed protein product [Owenia fusiformis]